MLVFPLCVFVYVCVCVCMCVCVCLCAFVCVSVRVLSTLEHCANTRLRVDVSRSSVSRTCVFRLPDEAFDRGVMADDDCFDVEAAVLAGLDGGTMMMMMTESFV